MQQQLDCRDSQSIIVTGHECALIPKKIRDLEAARAENLLERREGIGADPMFSSWVPRTASVTVRECARRLPIDDGRRSTMSEHESSTSVGAGPTAAEQNHEWLGCENSASVKRVQAKKRLMHENGRSSNLIEHENDPCNEMAGASDQVRPQSTNR